MRRLVKVYIEYLEMQNYAERTYTHRDTILNDFVDWIEDRGLNRFNDVTKPILERYRRHLYHSRDKHGKPMSAYVQHTKLVPLRMFFRWLSRQNYILYNPASELELPRLPTRLPKHTLTAAEAERVISQPDIGEPVGLRDRAIMETFYSTGIRRMEMVNLTCYDIDHERGSLAVRLGKGKKDRFVPIGDRALSWISKYLNEVRPTFAMEPDPMNLFIEPDGRALNVDRLSRLARKYVDQSGIKKTGACHLFRHTVATLMLENGADIRFIQQMLGHAKLQTTEIYTRVSIMKLKEIHSLTHPARATKDVQHATTDEAMPTLNNNELFELLDSEAED